MAIAADFRTDAVTASPAGRAPERRVRAALAVLVFVGLVCVQFSAWTPDAGLRETYDPTLNEQLARGSEGSSLREAGLLLLGLVAIVSWAARRRGDEVSPPGPSFVLWMLFVMTGYGLVSVAWADEPLLSFKRWVAAVLLGAGALAVRRRMALDEIARLVFVTTLVEAALSIAFELASGAFSLTAEYRFSGGLHPNAQALICAFLVVSSVVLWQTQPGWMTRAAAGAGVSIGSMLLVLTRSRTTLAALLVAGMAVILVSSRRSSPRVVIAGGALLVFVLLSISPALRSSAVSAALLGRETDTDRTPIWLDCLEYVRERPLLGYGYNAFWTTTHVEEVAAMEKWGVAEAHSAYLEALLDGGWVELVLLATLLAGALFVTGARWRWSRATEDGFAFAVVVFATLHGLLESAAVRPGVLMFVALAAMTHAGAMPNVSAVRPFAFRPGALVPGRLATSVAGRMGGAR